MSDDVTESLRSLIPADAPAGAPGGRHVWRVPAALAASSAAGPGRANVGGVLGTADSELGDASLDETYYARLMRQVEATSGPPPKRGRGRPRKEGVLRPPTRRMRHLGPDRRAAIDLSSSEGEEDPNDMLESLGRLHAAARAAANPGDLVPPMDRLARLDELARQPSRKRARGGPEPGATKVTGLLRKAVTAAGLKSRPGARPPGAGPDTGPEEADASNDTASSGEDTEVTEEEASEYDEEEDEEEEEEEEDEEEAEEEEEDGGNDDEPTSSSPAPEDPNDEEDGGYFANLGRSSTTPSNTLSKWPALDPAVLQSALSTATDGLFDGHRAALVDAIGSEDAFSTWLGGLRAGFSQLLFGFGSKHRLLERFADWAADRCPAACVVEINGFFPLVNFRAVLAGILSLLEIPHSVQPPPQFKHVADQADYIASYFNRFCDLGLIIVVHNIDGRGLRTTVTQNALAVLAASRGIGVIASADHISTPLLWDTASITKFNWIWRDATTYCPYMAEISFEGSVIGRKTELSIQGAAFVMRSMTALTREIFLLLAEQQLERMRAAGGGGDGAGSQDSSGAVDSRPRSARAHSHHPARFGLPFDVLFLAAADAFLVSSEQRLHEQLKEFIDHRLVVVHRLSGLGSSGTGGGGGSIDAAGLGTGAGGEDLSLAVMAAAAGSLGATDVLYIPLDADALSQVISQTRAM
ncbi:hypothetical protein H696_00419 [Fonticula alba]|uniref:Origin recognition complex subunit 2 n=1 Tax=Fonticula alba TaxID=691883 RepID=A0A058ZEP7_FONAL|nr:hypothetical protein H696_00419 [Fonticula alba]KCV72844.1 hypothetical protein H696_00419 [Fonticula alba]|eukprot:XP_009492545.1 hypothetical protein H696_00419 [Fonticula alba]